MNDTVKHWLVVIVVVIAILAAFKIGVACWMIWEGSIVKKAADKLSDYKDRREGKI